MKLGPAAARRQGQQPRRLRPARPGGRRAAEVPYPLCLRGCPLVSGGRRPAVNCADTRLGQPVPAGRRRPCSSAAALLLRRLPAPLCRLGPLQAGCFWTQPRVGLKGRGEKLNSAGKRPSSVAGAVPRGVRSARASRRHSLPLKRRRVFGLAFVGFSHKSNRKAELLSRPTVAYPEARKSSFKISRNK